MIQIFFAYEKQLKAAQRFTSGYIIIIDRTFNTNNLRLPLLIVVGVLNLGVTFPVAFSYSPSELTESIGFVWESLKVHCFNEDIAKP